ncbi:MAG: C-GCAxxG-C-C family (seleno)protein [Eisenbergiella sp.]
MDIFERMLELSGQVFYCAQILMILALESEGKEDPDLIRAAGGLNGGLGFSGGYAECHEAAAFSYFRGKGGRGVGRSDAVRLTGELADWFETMTADRYGCTCEKILDGNPE